MVKLYYPQFLTNMIIMAILTVMEISQATLYTIITNEIEKIPAGQVFDHSRFNISDSRKISLRRVLKQLIEAGAIIRLTHGKFYKPLNNQSDGQFPTIDEIVKALTVKGDKPFGYLTGASLYKRWGLTHYTSNVLHIAVNEKIPYKTFHSFKIKYQKQKILITEENIPQLQILDAIRDIKKIPGADLDVIIDGVVKKINRLNIENQWQLFLIAQHYNLPTKLLTMAIFENYFSGFDTQSFNNAAQCRQVRIGISHTVLPNKNKWNIA